MLLATRILITCVGKSDGFVCECEANKQGSFGGWAQDQV